MKLLYIIIIQTSTGIGALILFDYLLYQMNDIIIIQTSTGIGALILFDYLLYQMNDILNDMNMMN